MSKRWAVSQRVVRSLVAAAAVAALPGSPTGAQDEQTGGGFEVELRVTGEKTYAAPGDVTAVAASFGGRIAAGTKDGQLAVWIQGGGGSKPPRFVKAHTKQINAIQFSPDASLIATASDDGQVALWRVDSKADTLARADRFEPGKGPKALTLDFSFDGQSVAAGDDKGGVRVWGVEGTKPARVFEHHKGKILAVAFKPRDNNTLFVIGEDKMLSSWNLSTGEQASGDIGLLTDAEKKPPAPKYFTAAVAEDGSRFAIPAMRVNIIGNYSGVVNQHWIKVARPTGEQFYFNASTLLVGSNEKPAIALSPDGRLLAVTGESEKRTNRMYVWNLVKRSPVGNFTLPARIRQFAIGPGNNGYQVTVAAGSEVKTFPVDFSSTGEPTETLAVLDLKSDQPNLGAAIADVVRTEIARKNQYILLSNANVAELMDDLNLSETDMADPKGRLQSGKILLAKKNVLGSIQKVGARYTLALLLQDRETQRVVWSDQKPCPASKPDALIELAQTMTRDLLASAAQKAARGVPVHRGAQAIADAR